jgi:radical SAM protein with 4Fe4S-binding SPASM domain
MQRPRQAMPMESFRHVVRQAQRMGVDTIEFNVMIGDPLLDPDFLERATYIRSFPQVKEVGFTTTLQWLHKFDINEFFRCHFSWISVSTTLSGRQSYRGFFGVDKYDQMLANLALLLQRNNQCDRRIGVTIDIKPTPERAREICSHSDFRHIQSLTSQDLTKLVRSQEFYVGDWGGAVQVPGYLKLRPTPLPGSRPCRRLYGGLMVFSNGKVGACNCRDFEASSELILGTLHDDSLDSMWRSQRLADIREGWEQAGRIPAVCRSCRHYSS